MTQKQISFLKAMLSECTITAAAEKAGITRKTAYSYLENDEFKAELEKRQNESLNDAVRYIQANLAKCSAELMRIIDSDNSPQIKINAVNTIFSNYRTLIDMKINAEAMKRLTEIERKLNETRDYKKN